MLLYIKSVFFLSNALVIMQQANNDIYLKEVYVLFNIVIITYL